MAECSRCGRKIFGDDIYALNEKSYCDHCAMILQKQSKSASPTGFGCSGPTVLRNTEKNKK